MIKAVQAVTSSRDGLSSSVHTLAPSQRHDELSQSVPMLQQDKKGAKRSMQVTVKLIPGPGGR